MTKEKIQYIREALPPTELLAQLAEEATELAHAALKLRRALDGTNPTPTGRAAALDQLKEEAADVGLCLEVLGVDVNAYKYREIMATKLTRWAKRLAIVKEGRL